MTLGWVDNNASVSISNESFGLPSRLLHGEKLCRVDEEQSSPNRQAYSP